MAPKRKDEKQAAESLDEAGDQKVLMETELVMAVLQSRLGRYQEVGEKLAVENFKLTDELAKQKVTLQDINEFLTNELKARSVATTQLEERVAELNQRMQEVQRDAQAEVARVRSEAATEVLDAADQVESLKNQLGNSQEFMGQKQQLERQVEQLTAALSAKQKEAEQKLSDMERRHLQDKEKMRKDMAAKIRETKIAMAQLADQHLEGSTKRALVENEAMAAELGYHAEQSSRLATANSSLRAEAAELKRQLEVAHKTVDSTTRKNVLLQQTIKGILYSLQQEGASAAAVQAAMAAAEQTDRSHSPIPGSYSPSKAAQAGGAAAAATRFQHLSPRSSASSAVLPGHEAVVACSAAGQELDSSNPVWAAVLAATQQQQQQQQAAAGAPANTGAGPVTGNDGAASCVSQQQHISIVHCDQQEQLQQHSIEDATAARNAVITALEQRVLHLVGELTASKQALAAAVQGSMLQGTQGFIVDPDAAASMNCASPTGAGMDSYRYGIHSNSSSKGCLSRARSGSPASRQWQQQGLDSATAVGPAGGSPESAAAATGAASGRASMAAALEDGVAPFVLHVVQQLRRGTLSSPPTAAAAAGSPPPPSAATAGALKGGKARVHAREGSSGSSNGSSDVAAREQLAQLLLEQLHSYARWKTAPYQGLNLAVPAADAAAEHGGASSQLHEAAGRKSESVIWQPGSSSDLQHATAVQASYSKISNINSRRSRGTEQHAREEAMHSPGSSRGKGVGSSSSLVLPPLPTLLSMALSPPASPTSAAVGSNAGVGCMGTATVGAIGTAGSRNSSAVRNSAEGLFGTVLSDGKPWSFGGPGSLAQQQQHQHQQHHHPKHNLTPTSPAEHQQPSIQQYSMQHAVTHAAAGALGGRLINTEGSGTGRASPNDSAGKLIRRSNNKDMQGG